MTNITYKITLDGIDWAAFKAALIADNWDNGRTPAQYRISSENSYFNCLAYAGNELVGTLRVLSDGVCNAYIVDVWTHSAHRRQGIARHMLELALEKLPGQHVYLFTDEAAEVYEHVGFVKRGIGLEKVPGTWLQNESLQAK